MQQQSALKNRVARDLASWKRIEENLVERYGRKVLYDRDFLKAKRDIYRYIRRKYNRSALNLYERTELKVLRGQHRRMVRQLYPNPFVRLTRNMLVFAGNVLLLPARVGISALKTVFMLPQTNDVGYKAGVLPSSSTQQKPGQTQGKDQQPILRTIPLEKKGQGQSKAITRKMPVRSRVHMPARQAKGVRL